MVAVEAQHGFAPSQFRLWLALHEVTHRLPVHGRPLAARLLRLPGLRAARAPLGPTRRASPTWLRRVADEVRNGRNPAREGGRGRHAGHPRAAAGALEDPGMMSLLEGHGDVTMDRAGAAEVPGAGPLLRGAARAPHPGPGPRPSSCPAAARARGQDAPVRRGRALRRVRGGGRRAGAAGPGLARAPSGCRRWRRSAIPADVGGPGRWAERPGTAPASLASSIADLPPLHLPAAGHGAGLRRLGRRRLAGAAGPGHRRRVRVTAIHVDHGLRPGSDAGGRRRGRRGGPPRARGFEGRAASR